MKEAHVLVYRLTATQRKGTIRGSDQEKTLVLCIYDSNMMKWNGIRGLLKVWIRLPIEFGLWNFRDYSSRHTEQYLTKEEKDFLGKSFGKDSPYLRPSYKNKLYKAPSFLSTVQITDIYFTKVNISLWS